MALRVMSMAEMRLEVILEAARSDETVSAILQTTRDLQGDLLRLPATVPD